MALMLLYHLMGFLPERSLCDKKEKKTYGKSKDQRFPKQLLLALTILQGVVLDYFLTNMFTIMPFYFLEFVKQYL